MGFHKGEVEHLLVLTAGLDKTLGVFRVTEGRERCEKVHAIHCECFGVLVLVLILVWFKKMVVVFCGIAEYVSSFCVVSIVINLSVFLHVLLTQTPKPINHYHHHHQGGRGSVGVYGGIGLDIKVFAGNGGKGEV